MEGTEELKKRIAMALVEQQMPMRAPLPIADVPLSLDDIVSVARPIIPDMNPVDASQFLGEIEVGVPVKKGTFR